MKNTLLFVILFLNQPILSQPAFDYEQAYGYAYQDKGGFYKIGSNDKTVVGSFNDHAVIADLDKNGDALKWKSLKSTISAHNSVITDIQTDIFNGIYTIAGMCTGCVAGRKGQVAFLAVLDTAFNFKTIATKTIHYFFPKIDSFQVREQVKLLRLGNLIYLAYSGDSGFGTDIYMHALNGADLSQRWQKQINTNFFEIPVMLEFEGLNITLGLHGWGKSRLLKLAEKDGALLKQFDFTDIPAQFASLGSGRYAMAYKINDSMRVSTIDTAGKEPFVSYVKLNTLQNSDYAISGNGNSIAVTAFYQDVKELPYFLANNRVYFFDTRLANSKPIEIIIPENGCIGRNIKQIIANSSTNFILIGDRPTDGQGRPFFYRKDLREYKPSKPSTWYNSSYCQDSTLVEKVLQRTYPNTLPHIRNNIVYATKSNFQNKQVPLWMDIYRPYDHYAMDSKEKRPAFIYIHGGGYVFGSEDGAGNVLFRAAERGMIGIGVKYRIGYLPPLVPDSLPSLINNGISNTYRALQDVIDAVKWVHDHADEYYIDKSKIFIGGHSAGGNAVLNYNYVEEKDFIASIISPLGKLNPKMPIAGTVSMAGPLNQLSNEVKSALDYIQTNEKIPIYLAHGTCDSTALYDKGSFIDPTSPSNLGAYPIVCRLQSLKHPYHFTTIKGGGHGLEPVENEITASIFKWIKKEVSCGTTINACELFTIPKAAACFNVPTCPSCTSTPIRGTENIVLRTYPNPFSHSFTIEADFKNGITELSVVDMFGRVLYIDKKFDSTNKKIVNLNHLSPGQYLIKWTQENLLVNTKKIIKL